MFEGNSFKTCIILFIFSILIGAGSNVQSLIISDLTDIPDITKTFFANESSVYVLDNVTILYLEGSSYEMGYQHGLLLKDKAIENLRAFLSFSENLGYCYQMLLEGWNQSKPYVPKEYIDEMKGLSDATNISMDLVAIGNIAVMFAHCSGISAWGNATIDGLLYHMRSLDYPLTVKDPVSNRFLQENSVLIIRNPEHGFASCDPSFAGFIGSLGGFNEKGIAVEVLSSWSHDETKKGTPMVFRQRMILDHAENAEQALQILTTNTTLGWNHILSDANSPIGYAVETSGHNFYFGTSNDPIESMDPFYSIPNVVRRTNIFIHPDLAETQRQIYNPLERPLLHLLNGKSKLGWGILPSFVPWIHYQTISEQILQYHGNLDLNTTMKMTRDIYQGRTNILFKFLLLSGLYVTLNQWVACPETGDIAVSFADKMHNAYEQPIHHFNLFELLE